MGWCLIMFSCGLLYYTSASESVLANNAIGEYEFQKPPVPSQTAGSRASEQNALMKLIESNPDMNLAQLAKAWNVPIDEQSLKFMSSVNIKVLVSAISQSSADGAGGEECNCCLRVQFHKVKN